MQIKCKMTATVLQDEVREVQKGDKKVKEHTLMVHQDGSRETLKVIVPADEEFQKYSEYEFDGVLSSSLYNGVLYTKFTSL